MTWGKDMYNSGDEISRETIAELIELDLVTIDERGKIAVCEWWKRETVKFFKEMLAGHNSKG